MTRFVVVDKFSFAFLDFVPGFLELHNVRVDRVEHVAHFTEIVVPQEVQRLQLKPGRCLNVSTASNDDNGYRSGDGDGGNSSN